MCLEGFSRLISLWGAASYQGQVSSHGIRCIALISVKGLGARRPGGGSRLQGFIRTARSNPTLDRLDGGVALNKECLYPFSIFAANGLAPTHRLPAILLLCR